MAAARSQAEQQKPVVKDGSAQMVMEEMYIDATAVTCHIAVTLQLRDFFPCSDHLLFLVFFSVSHHSSLSYRHFVIALSRSTI